VISCAICFAALSPIFPAQCKYSLVFVVRIISKELVSLQTTEVDSTKKSFR